LPRHNLCQPVDKDPFLLSFIKRAHFLHERCLFQLAGKFRSPAPALYIR
jgi:hypothetical protein